MIQLREADNVYIDASLVGFTKQLVNDGVAERQVDLLLVGAAYAIQHQIPPPETIRRHDLLHVALLSAEIRLALEAALGWYAREQQLDEATTPRQLLDLLARAGSAGLSAIRENFDVLSLGQSRLWLLNLYRAGVQMGES